MKNTNKSKAFYLIVMGIFLVLSACNLPVGDSNLEPELIAAPDEISMLPSVTQQTETATRTQTPIPPSPTATTTLTPTFTETPLPTDTPTPTETFTPTITPTYAILRGKVLPERANCRYGPGAAYLYKYGLVGGSNLEIIGRNQLGTWVLIQAIGGDNPCWVKGELMEIKDDVMSVEPVPPHIIQAWSPYYAPLTNVYASRDKNDPSKVTISWSPLVLRAGDDAEQVPYVIEAWICQDGEIVFNPIGAYETIVLVIDEPGCKEPSHGQVLGAEKHGYTKPVIIVWP
ncbi:MAG: hypothetical protein ISR58_00435 [Anaerolineales bacterium]|nr:hypothetical protein [Chloroflexota bacterium]MBL6979630.1 hypothetical protein [Anaerolineales bacterium]